MVLVAIIGTLRIALHQPDQTATTNDESRRTPRPAGAGSPRVTMTPAPTVPAGFQWMEAGPVPRVRSGLALVMILAAVGALLAVAVAGLVVALATAAQSTL